MMSHLGEIIEDIKAALGYGNVHCVFGGDVNGCPRLWKNYEVVSVNRTLVLDGVVLHLQEQRSATNNQLTDLLSFQVL